MYRLFAGPARILGIRDRRRKLWSQREYKTGDTMRTMLVGVCLLAAGSSPSRRMQLNQRRP